MRHPHRCNCVDWPKTAATWLLRAVRQLVPRHVYHDDDVDVDVDASAKHDDDDEHDDVAAVAAAVAVAAAAVCCVSVVARCALGDCCT